MIDTYVNLQWHCFARTLVSTRSRICKEIVGTWAHSSDIQKVWSSVVHFTWKLWEIKKHFLKQKETDSVPLSLIFPFYFTSSTYEVCNLHTSCFWIQFYDFQDINGLSNDWHLCQSAMTLFCKDSQQDQGFAKENGLIWTDTRLALS